MKFILSAAAGALGVLVTFIFIPEITSLDLREGDIRWDLIKKGGSFEGGSTCSCHSGHWQATLLIAESL